MPAKVVNIDGRTFATEPVRDKPSTSWPTIAGHIREYAAGADNGEKIDASMCYLWTRLPGESIADWRERGTVADHLREALADGRLTTERRSPHFGGRHPATQRVLDGA